MGDIWSSSQADARVLYQDGGATIDLPDGALWTFGDTFLGTTSPSGSLVPPSKENKPRHDGAVSATIARYQRPNTPAASSVPVTRPSVQGVPWTPPVLEYARDAGGTAACPFPYFADESKEKRRIWPLGGVALGGRLYLYYVMIEVTDAPAPWNFRQVGSGLARAERWNEPFTRLTPGGDWRFPVGPSEVLIADGWLYLYEVKGDEPGRGLRIARVRPADLENPSKYEYCTGVGSGHAPRWSSRPADMATLLQDVAGQFSMKWNERLGAYLCVTSSDLFRPHEIGLRTAAGPCGPFSRVTYLKVPEKTGKKTNLIYCAFQHLELTDDGGASVAISYCRMLNGDWELSNPEIVTVELGPAE